MEPTKKINWSTLILGIVIGAAVVGIVWAASKPVATSTADLTVNPEASLQGQCNQNCEIERGNALDACKSFNGRTFADCQQAAGNNFEDCRAKCDTTGGGGAGGRCTDDGSCEKAGGCPDTVPPTAYSCHNGKLTCGIPLDQCGDGGGVKGVCVVGDVKCSDCINAGFDIACEVYNLKLPSRQECTKTGNTWCAY